MVGTVDAFQYAEEALEDNYGENFARENPIIWASFATNLMNEAHVEELRNTLINLLGDTSQPRRF